MAVVDEPDRGPSEYRRQLTDVELVAFALDVGQRTQTLLSQGMPLPMADIQSHHLMGLMEAIAGPKKSLQVREWHLTWLDRMLDQAEAAARMHVLGMLDDLPDRPANAEGIEEFMRNQ